jgi:hypothetical protein
MAKFGQKCKFLELFPIYGHNLLNDYIFQLPMSIDWAHSGLSNEAKIIFQAPKFAELCAPMLKPFSP